MAQVTESLIAEYERAHAEGKHAPMTIGEEQQLIHAWKQQHKSQQSPARVAATQNATISNSETIAPQDGKENLATENATIQATVEGEPSITLSKLREIFANYGVPDTGPGWIEHFCEKRQKLVRDSLTEEGEVIMLLETLCSALNQRLSVKEGEALIPDNELCPNCKGSGESMCVVGRPPDDYWDEVGPCPKCDGEGTLLAAYKNALQQISLAGMTLPMLAYPTEETTREFHARQAWKFISIAANALSTTKQEEA